MIGMLAKRIGVRRTFEYGRRRTLMIALQGIDFLNALGQRRLIVVGHLFDGH
jgi:hypothetical protein